VIKNKQVITLHPSLPKPLQPPPNPLRRRGRKRGCGRKSRQELSLGRNYKCHTHPAFRRNATNKDRVANLRLALLRKQSFIGYLFHVTKAKDALHISCAIEANCNFFITTDDGILKKYKNGEIKVCSPIEIINLWEDLL
jgi:hypothetical protein